MGIFNDITAIQNIIYIVASILFISGIKMLGKEDTAVKGNFLSALAMFIAVSVTVVDIVNPMVLIGGIVLGAIIGSTIALKVKMTSIPEMVALFNGFGGLATFLIAWSEFNSIPDNLFQHILVMTTLYIGGVTFTGSLVAYAKLAEKIKIAKTSIITKFFTTIFYISLAFLLYSVFVTPAIVPAFDFFTILLVLTLLGGIGFVLPIGGGDMPVVISLLNSFSGIAAAFAGLLLLNPIMDSVDVAVVIGANDVVNPSATEEPGSPIYGMPIIEVHNAKTVFVLKRSMSAGFAGVQNPLFFKQNTRMLFGDAKESIGGLVSEFKD